MRKLLFLMLALFSFSLLEPVFVNHADAKEKRMKVVKFSKHKKHKKHKKHRKHKVTFKVRHSHHINSPQEGEGVKLENMVNGM